MSQEETLDDIINYPPQIVGLLNRICDAHIILSVGLDNDKHLYSSALVETYPEQNTMILDELYPRTGHNKIKEGTILHVQTRLKGIDTQFDCQVNHIEESSGIAAYHIKIPDSIAYYQRRKQFRAQLDYQAEIYVQMQLRNKKSITGQVFDVSVNGIGLHLDPAAGLVLERKQQIKDIIIEFPDCKPFTTTLEICSIRLNKPGTTLIVGTQFIALQQKNERQVQHYVAVLDRQARQNRR